MSSEMKNTSNSGVEFFIF